MSVFYSPRSSLIPWLFGWNFVFWENKPKKYQMLINYSTSKSTVDWLPQDPSWLQKKSLSQSKIPWLILGEIFFSALP